MLLSPGSPVLKVVKHVVIKSAPDLMWSSIMGADCFICGDCGQSMWSFSLRFRHLMLSYCNSYERVCQEVSRVNIWVAVVKEKSQPHRSLLSRTNKRDKLTKVKINLQI